MHAVCIQISIYHSEDSISFIILSINRYICDGSTVPLFLHYVWSHFVLFLF